MTVEELKFLTGIASGNLDSKLNAVMAYLFPFSLIRKGPNVSIHNYPKGSKMMETSFKEAFTLSLVFTIL